MCLVSSRSCLRSIHWSQLLSWEWRCCWSSADRRCSNYIWVINNFITYWGENYIRGFTVIIFIIVACDCLSMSIFNCAFGVRHGWTITSSQKSRQICEMQLRIHVLISDKLLMKNNPRRNIFNCRLKAIKATGNMKWCPIHQKGTHLEVFGLLILHSSIWPNGCYWTLYSPMYCGISHGTYLLPKSIEGSDY